MRFFSDLVLLCSVLFCLTGICSIFWIFYHVEYRIKMRWNYFGRNLHAHIYTCTSIMMKRSVRAARKPKSYCKIRQSTRDGIPCMSLNMFNKFIQLISTLDTPATIQSLALVHANSPTDTHAHNMKNGMPLSTTTKTAIKTEKIPYSFIHAETGKSINHRTTNEPSTDDWT